MRQEQLRRLGWIGLILLALVAVFYVFVKQRQKKREEDIPLDDRLGS